MSPLKYPGNIKSYVHMELWPLLHIPRRRREKLKQAGENLLPTKTHNFQFISFTVFALHFP
jgi:hypothetical protein